MEERVRRASWTLAACAAVACMLAGAVHAAPGLLVGVADDTLKWTDKPQAQLALAQTRDLGLRAVRVTVPWQPGETRLGVVDRKPVDRMILATWGGGLRVVLAVYGRPDDAPRTDADRDAYCTFVASLLQPLSRRRRRRDLERAEHRPVLAAAVRPRRHERRAGRSTRRCSPAAGTSCTRHGRA